ncbi:MAG: hypothetical protein ACFBWO_09325 [Paracoccaceae bacterium]
MRTLMDDVVEAAVTGTDQQDYEYERDTLGCAYPVLQEVPPQSDTKKHLKNVGCDDRVAGSARTAVERSEFANVVLSEALPGHRPLPLLADNRAATAKPGKRKAKSSGNVLEEMIAQLAFIMISALEKSVLPANCPIR